MSDDAQSPIRRIDDRSARGPSAHGRFTRDIERAQRNPHLRDHLSQSERIRVGTRQHPVVLLRPALLVLVAFAVLLRSLSDSSALVSVQKFFLVLFLVAVGWFGVCWLQWSRHFFLATDQRVLKMYGVLSTTVDSMKVQKVTDMTYHRSFLGEIIGYGSITIESAGQDQALHDIDYIPYPRENYQELCHVILGEDPRTGGLKKHRFRRRVESLTRRGHESFAEYEEFGYPEHDDGNDYPEHEGGDSSEPAYESSPRMLYSSQDGRAEETSPIPIYPPGYFSGRDDGGGEDDHHNDPTRN